MGIMVALFLIGGGFLMKTQNDAAVYKKE